MDINTIKESSSQTLTTLLEQLNSQQFYFQLAATAAVVGAAWMLASIAGRYLKNAASRLAPDHPKLSRAQKLLFPLALVLAISLLMSLPDEIKARYLQQTWMLVLVQGLASVFLLFKTIKLLVDDGFIRSMLLWVLIPIALLKVFGVLDPASEFLGSIKLTLGNITISLLAILRGVVFGILLFWLGRRSNVAGQQAIRKNEKLDIGTKELLAKLFEIGLFFLLFIVLLQIIGINLTTLAVFGGAVGVGLGFGLQAIAANFISGMIILFDRSIKVGDHIQMGEDVFGELKEIKLRYAVIETFEGKEIMIPNEKFISDTFTNWSYTDSKQRYDFKFSVSYDTDLEKLFPVIREAIAKHPQVISGDDAPEEERPDAEIDNFGDSGIEILVEFWMHGVDDGKNRVDADLKMIVWQTLKEHGFSMPFPQREVRILS